MNEHEKPRRNRRTFLRGAVALGGAAGVAAATGTAFAETVPVQVDANAVTEKAQKRGYRLTPHIEQYYRLAGF